MILTSRDLLEMAPFTTGLREHDDLDWALRASAVEGAGVEFVPTSEPLAIWYLDEDRPRLSLATDWRYSLHWLRSSSHLFTRRAYASFVLTWIGSDVARQGRWGAFWPLLREAFRRGRPVIIDVLIYVAHWSLPEGVKRRVAALFARYRTTRGSGE
jgi:hypothetical protein